MCMSSLWQRMQMFNIFFLITRTSCWTNSRVAIDCYTITLIWHNHNVFVITMAGQPPQPLHVKPLYTIPPSLAIKCPAGSGVSKMTWVYVSHSKPNLQSGHIAHVSRYSAGLFTLLSLIFWLACMSVIQKYRERVMRLIASHTYVVVS